MLQRLVILFWKEATQLSSTKFPFPLTMVRCTQGCHHSNEYTQRFSKQTLNKDRGNGSAPCEFEKSPESTPYLSSRDRQTSSFGVHYIFGLFSTPIQWSRTITVSSHLNQGSSNTTGSWCSICRCRAYICANIAKHFVKSSLTRGGILI